MSPGAEPNINRTAFRRPTTPSRDPSTPLPRNPARVVQESPRGRRTPALDSLHDSRTPFQEPLQGLRTPMQESLHGFRTSGQDSLHGRRTPVQESFQGLRAPAQESHHGRRTPVQDPLHGRITPVQERSPKSMRSAAAPTRIPSSPQKNLNPASGTPGTPRSHRQISNDGSHMDTGRKAVAWTPR